MITFEGTLTGGQVARQLKDNPEEAAYMFAELADEAPGDFAEEVALYAPGDRGKLSRWLRRLADEVESV